MLVGRAKSISHYEAAKCFKQGKLESPVFDKIFHNKLQLYTLTLLITQIQQLLADFASLSHYSEVIKYRYVLWVCRLTVQSVA